ncbi:MAG: CopG family transcriptional regulator [Acidimicrobiales bacterium]
MRTTISIDDDVLVAVKERARREGLSAGEVISDLARRALTGDIGSGSPSGRSHNGFVPLPHRGVAVSNALIDQLRAEEPE